MNSNPPPGKELLPASSGSVSDTPRTDWHGMCNAYQDLEHAPAEVLLQIERGLAGFDKLRAENEMLRDEFARIKCIIEGGGDDDNSTFLEITGICERALTKKAE